MNCGSGESLKCSLRCGFRPKARQIRLIADCDIPVAFAIERVDQWVASRGLSSSVRVERLGPRREADKVAEQHGDDLAFSARFPRRHGAESTT